jgi:chromosome segregation ATPase
MERSKLTEIGLNEEQINSVMKLYNSDVDPLKNQLGELKTENESLNTKVEDRDSKIDELSKEAGNSQKLNQKIADLQGEIKQHDDDAQTKLREAQLNNAIELALRDANVRDSKAVLPFLDKDTVKLEDGKLTGINEQVEQIKADHDYLFNSGEPTGPNSYPTPNGNRTNNIDEVPNLSKMSYSEIAELKTNDPDAYNAAVEQSAK